MASIDNLNYYSNGLPAGQQTDKYSSQPGCLKSKNLDIFSSSKSVKATAWSTPVNISESGIVLTDQTGNLVLKSDGGVYDRSSGTDVLVKSGIASNFPVAKVSYNGRYGTYADATWGTEKQLISKYENGTLKAFDLFTDRVGYAYSAENYIVLMNENDDRPETRMIGSSDKWTAQGTSGVTWRKADNSWHGSIKYKIKDLRGLTSAPVYIKAQNSSYESEGVLTIRGIYIEANKYYYNAETNSMVPITDTDRTSLTITNQPNNATGAEVRYDIPLRPLPEDADDYGTEYMVIIDLEVVAGTAGTYTWSSGVVMIYAEGGYNDYYSYLPLDENRYLKDIGEYYWSKGVSSQTLYNWEGEWINHIPGWSRAVRYSLEKYMGWANDVSMDVISMIAWNEQIYMIGNMNGNGYIIPCDLTGGRGTPYIAYGCTFKGATNIDYLLYLVGEDRGISQLWVYNGQELVTVIGGNKEATTNDIIDVEEQYKFDGKMVEYRGDLILSTSDNRIFQYGQTYGGKGGAFIHEIPGTITGIKADGNDLKIEYSVTDGGITTKYLTIYQDDTPIKNYNTEWMAEYPIILGNHLLEKEESDLYASYILPSIDCKLEFWGSANHYHFWTFKVAHNTTTPEVGTKWSIEKRVIPGWITYMLEFVERVGDYLTFKLIGDLPKITGEEDGTIWRAEGGNVITIPYTEVNHFRKIGEITTSKYTEGEFRFTNLNNKLELPKSHSLQIMVKGKGTVNYTPELFSLDLVANQRERG